MPSDMKIIDGKDHWRWGLRWRVIPWKFRYVYYHVSGKQKYIGVDREWMLLAT